MSSSDDALKIPIEIKTDDLDEIRELINEISNAESDIRTMKALPKKGRGEGPSRSAFETETDERGGIFGGPALGDEALPLKSRDKTSKQALQKENQFAKLKEQVNEIEQTQADQLKGALGTATQAVGFGQMVGIQGGAGIRSELAKFATRAFLPLAVVTTIVEVAHTVLDQLLKPGGLWDIRFKRNIKEEIASASERTLKAQITQGLKVIRMTSYSGQRSQAYAGTVEAHKAGVPIYDMNMEMRGKGLQ